VGWCWGGAAVVLRRCCGGAALVLRALFFNMSVSRGRRRKNDAQGLPRASREFIFSNCASRFGGSHFASKPSLLCRNIAILTRGENGDFALEVCTFRVFMSFPCSHFQSF
jgi:hypothetical protein